VKEDKKKTKKEKYLKKLHEKLRKPLLSPVKKKTKGSGARVSVQGGIKTLLDLA